MVDVQRVFGGHNSETRGVKRPEPNSGGVAEGEEPAQDGHSPCGSVLEGRGTTSTF